MKIRCSSAFICVHLRSSAAHSIRYDDHEESRLRAEPLPSEAGGEFHDPVRNPRPCSRRFRALSSAFICVHRRLIVSATMTMKRAGSGPSLSHPKLAESFTILFEIRGRVVVDFVLFHRRSSAFIGGS